MHTLARALVSLLDAVLPRPDSARIIANTSDMEFGRLLSPVLTANGTVALLPYRHRLVRAAILEAKFNGNAKARRILGGALADYLASVEEEAAGFDSVRPVLVPVPLGSARRRERGYNQIEEVARAAGVQTVPALRRTRDTQPQTSLSRKERLANVTDAFRASGAIDPHAAYIVLDDVVTTGATLAAAAEALRSAGASRVLTLALAHS